MKATRTQTSSAANKTPTIGTLVSLLSVVRISVRDIATHADEIASQRARSIQFVAESVWQRHAVAAPEEVGRVIDEVNAATESARASVSEHHHRVIEMLATECGACAARIGECESLLNAVAFSIDASLGVGWRLSLVAALRRAGVGLRFVGDQTVWTIGCPDTAGLRDCALSIDQQCTVLAAAAEFGYARDLVLSNDETRVVEAFRAMPGEQTGEAILRRAFGRGSTGGHRKSLLKSMKTKGVLVSGQRGRKYALSPALFHHR